MCQSAAHPRNQAADAHCASRLQRFHRSPHRAHRRSRQLHSSSIVTTAPGQRIAGYRFSWRAFYAPWGGADQQIVSEPDRLLWVELPVPCHVGMPNGRSCRGTSMLSAFTNSAAYGVVSVAAPGSGCMAANMAGNCEFQLSVAPARAEGCRTGKSAAFGLPANDRPHGRRHSRRRRRQPEHLLPTRGQSRRFR